MIYIIGIGPGGESEMTPRAAAALDAAELIVGYDKYIELLGSKYAGRTLSTPMRKEAERCGAVLEAARAGKTVALVCGGDAGVYGLAGMMLSLCVREGVEAEVIPGVTAATAAAAILGAPLIHDFAVVSLSDLLTPWELIEKRLEMAAKADFVICLYNPRSHVRPGHLSAACEILLRHKPPETPAGWVKNAGRDKTEARILTLGTLSGEDVDMFTTVIIGNSQTHVAGGWMITPRGYK